MKKHRLLFTAGLLLVSLAIHTGSVQKPKPAGQKLFEDLNCTMCHGEKREGTQLAPALKGIRKKWKRNDLIAYLNDPMKVTQENPRLRKQKEKYTEQDMPSFESITDEQMQTLVDWLMKLK